MDEYNIGDLVVLRGPPDKYGIVLKIIDEREDHTILYPAYNQRLYMIYMYADETKWSYPDWYLDLNARKG